MNTNRLRDPLLGVLACMAATGCGHSGAAAADALVHTALAVSVGAIEYSAARRADEHQLEARRPRRLAPARAAGPAACTQIRLRVHMSDDYMARGSSSDRGFSRVIEEANALLADQDMPVRFRVSSFERWRISTSGMPAGDVLRELAEHDAGDDVDLVVALIGRLVSLVPSTLDDIGDAHLLGRHVLLRAVEADAWAEAALAAPNASMSAIARAAAAERNRLAAAVLLHEWAHTLGVVHSLDDSSVMAPRYQRGGERFDPASRQIVIATTVDPSSPGDPPSPAARSARLRNLLERAPVGTFVTGESEALLARLRTLAAAPSR